MSDLLDNDCVLIANKRVVRNLAITMDHALEDSVGAAVAQLDTVAAIYPPLLTWMARGLEHPIELAANALLPVPRLLYATTNPAFNPAPGADSLQSLLNHMSAFDAAATGPVVATLPENFEIGPISISNPCPIQFRSDPNRRFTFLRNGFFANDAPDFLEVVADGLLMTMQGQAYRGDFCSRLLAQTSPTHTFQMTLRFDVTFINDDDMAFGRMPFRMTADPPPPSMPGLPSLPKKGSFIFATRDGVPVDGAVLPALIPFDGADDDQGPCDESAGCQPQGLSGDLFTGTLDDLIFETVPADPTTAVPRFRVEPRSDDEPERMVIRDVADPTTILAEAEGGRLALQFVKIEALTLTAIGQQPAVTNADRQNIAKSLTKFQPTMARLITCAIAASGSRVNLAPLALVGPRGMDLPLLPQSIAIPASARIVRSVDTEDIQDGHPVNSVRSGVSHCDLTARQYFPNADPEAQAFGIAGKIGGSGDTFINFSKNLDLSLGVTQTFIQPHLDAIGERVKSEIEGAGLEGLDPASLDFWVRISEDVIRIHVDGEGEIETPFFMPNIGYDFTFDLRLRMRAQKMVANRDGLLVDRFGCPIPPSVLIDLGLNLADNRLELPTLTSPLGIPEENPIGFYAYFDPGDGIACFTTPGSPCPQPFRAPPPVLDDNGDEIIIDDAANPPDICPGHPEADDEEVFGQVSWDLSDNEHLEPMWALTMVPPIEDDVDVDVSINYLALFFVSLLGAALGPLLLAVLGLLGPLGLALTPVVIMVGLTALILIPLSGTIIGSIATGLVTKQLRRQHAELGGNLVPNPIVGVFLDPAAPFALQSGFPKAGALIVRNHLVFQAPGIDAMIPF